MPYAGSRRRTLHTGPLPRADVRPVHLAIPVGLAHCQSEGACYWFRTLGSPPRGTGGARRGSVLWGGVCRGGEGEGGPPPGGGRGGAPARAPPPRPPPPPPPPLPPTHPSYPHL